MDKNGKPVTDHDLLIQLNTKFEIFMVQNKQDMTVLKDGYKEKINEHTATLSNHEGRINGLEALRDQIDPVTVVKDFKILQGQVHDFQISVKAWRVVGGMAGGAVLWILTQLPAIIDSFEKIFRIN